MGYPYTWDILLRWAVFFVIRTLRINKESEG